MLLLLNIILVVFLGLHFVFTTFTIRGLNKNVPAQKKRSTASISVLVAARNEAQNIERLLDSIAANVYDRSKYEIVVVDDHSEDDTQEIVKKWMAKSSVNVKLISAVGFGKKNAIEEGLKVCEYNLILQTDADCIVSNYWIESMSAHFIKPNVKLVAGPVELNPLSGLFEKIQGLEFSSLIASSIGLSQNGWSIMANAANLAYIKSAREELTFNEKSESGDDVFFMQQLANTSPESIVYLSDKVSLVTTIPASTVREFLNQRARWASKTGEYPNTKGKLIAVYILLLNCISVFAFFALLAFSENWMLPTAFLVTRFLLDYSILKLFYTHTLKKTLNPINVFLLSIVYPVYVLSVIFKIVFGKILWKGRQI